MTKEELLQQVLERSEITKECMVEITPQLLAMNDDDFFWIMHELAHGENVAHTENAKALMERLGPNDQLYQRCLVVHDRYQK
jgi:hypothetical protein